MLANRRDEITLFRLRSGHARHAAHLFRVGVLESDLCQRCLRKDNVETVETVDHVFLECAYVSQKVKDYRTVLQSKLQKKGCKLRDALISLESEMQKCILASIRALHESGIHL